LFVIIGAAGVLMFSAAKYFDQPRPTYPGWYWPVSGDTIGSIVDASGVPVSELAWVSVSKDCRFSKKTLSDVLGAMWDARSLRPPPDFEAWREPDGSDEPRNTESWPGDYLSKFSDWKAIPLGNWDLVNITRVGDESRKDTPGRTYPSYGVTCEMDGM
jgi:hypothetical protein